MGMQQPPFSLLPNPIAYIDYRSGSVAICP